MSRSCAYCGAPAAFKLTHGEYVQLITCATCADLPSLDPSYGLAETIARGGMHPLHGVVVAAARAAEPTRIRTGAARWRAATTAPQPSEERPA